MFRTTSRFMAFCVAAALVGFGCDSGTSTNGTPGGGDGHGHVHPTEGPHHGQLIELGNEQYHAELVHDDGSHTVTIYILDGTATEEVAIPESDVTLQLLVDGVNKTFVLAAATESGDVSQGASKFEIVDEDLVHILHDEHELKGRLQVNIGGTQFNGTFEHAEHDDHEGHGDEDADHDDHEGHDDDDADHEDHDDDDDDHADHDDGDTDN